MKVEQLLYQRCGIDEVVVDENGYIIWELLQATQILVVRKVITVDPANL